MYYNPIICFLLWLATGYHLLKTFPLSYTTSFILILRLDKIEFTRGIFLGAKELVFQIIFFTIEQTRPEHMLF